jgi:ubiquinone/menaquinone biosynthesis C-methylase UbiE
VGLSIRKGLDKSTGDVIVTLDGDLSHNPSEIPNLIDALNDCDMVCGSRYTQGGKADMSLGRLVVSSLFNIVFRNLLGLPVKDFTSGFRAYKRSIIESIKFTSNGFGIYIEVPIKTFLAGFTIKEIPIRYRTRFRGKSNLNYLKQGPEYNKVIINALKLRIFPNVLAEIEPKKIRNIYYNFSPDVDTLAVKSNKLVQRKWHEEKLDNVLEQLDLNEKRILDLGCGSGGLTFRVSQNSRNTKIIGLDFNDRAIKYANNKKLKDKNKKLQFIVGSAEKLPFKDNCFDTVIGLDILDHCISYKEVLGEIYKVVTHGGRILVTTENKKSLWPIVEKIWDRFGQSRNYGETHLICFDKYSLDQTIKDAGFDFLNMYTIHNIRTFFHVFGEYYPKRIDNFMKINCLGLTLVYVMKKPI